MKASHLSIEYLKVFCDLAKTKSFHKTAAQNFLTQSAISQQLLALEHRFGTKLIIRGHGEFELTPAGLIVLDGAHIILEAQQKTFEAIKNLSDDMTGTVRIESAYSVGLHLLPPIIRQFMVKNPKIKLELEYVHSDQVCADVLAGHCDLGIVVLPCPEAQTLLAHDFIQEKLLFVCSPQNGKAKEKSIRIKDLAEESFVSFEKNLSTRQIIEDIFQKHQVPLHVNHVFDNIETLKQSIEVGAGVSLLPESTVAQEVKNKTLVSVPLKEGPFYRLTGIVLKNKKKQSNATTVVLNWLLNHRTEPPRQP